MTTSGTLRYLLLPVLVLLAIAPGAFAATPIAPTGGAISPGPVTTFSWAYDPGEWELSVLVASSPAVDENGAFLPADVVTGFGNLGSSETSTKGALPPGNYWWQLSTNVPGKKPDQRTAPQAFSVPASRPPTAVAPADGARITHPTVSFSFNEGDVAIDDVSLARSPDALFDYDGTNDPLSSVFSIEKGDPDASGLYTISFELPSASASADPPLPAGEYWWGFHWYYLYQGRGASPQTTMSHFTVAPQIIDPTSSVSAKADQTKRTLRVQTTFVVNTLSGTVRATLKHGVKTLATARVALKINAREYGSKKTVAVTLAVPRSARAGDDYQVDLTIACQGASYQDTLDASLPMLAVDLTANPPKLVEDGTEPLVKTYRQAKALLLAKGWDAYSSLGWKQGATFQALVGILHISADGCNRLVFFFERGRYLGAGPDDCHLQPAGRKGETVRIAFPLYTPHDGFCCPSAGTAIVGFRWNGRRVLTIGHVPPRNARY